MTASVLACSPAAPMMVASKASVAGSCAATCSTSAVISRGCCASRGWTRVRRSMPMPIYHPSSDPELPWTDAALLDGSADPAERRRFAELWQARVKRLLLEHWDDEQVFTVCHVSADDGAQL